MNLLHRTIATALFAITVLSPAQAQQQQPSPSEQALGAKLMKEINDGLQCSATVVSAQAEIQRLQAKLKELEPKNKPAAGK